MIPNCPRCEYPLTGLPENHACPECGLRYDADSRIYRPAAGFTPVIGSASFVGSVLYAFQVLNAAHRVSARFRPIVYWAGLALVGLFTWVFWRYQGVKKQRLVAILPECLLIRLKTDRAEEISWANVSRVAANRGSMAASVFVRDLTMRTVGGVFRSKTEAADFANRAMRRIIYGSAYEVQYQPDPGKCSEAEADIHRILIDLKTYREPRSRWYVFPIIAGAPILIMTMPVSGIIKISIFGAFVFAAVIAEVISHFRTPRIPQRLTIDRFGVTLTRGGESILSLPWNEIKDATMSRVQGVFSIHGTGGQVLFQSSYTALGPFKEMKRATNEIQLLKQLYARERIAESISS